MNSEETQPRIVEISSAKFVGVCAVLALIILLAGRVAPFPAWLVAAEVLGTVLSLFVFGSIRYRIDKNAMTYGAALVICATFWQRWWESSFLKISFESEGQIAILNFIKKYFLTLHGLDQIAHADTMLFILGLTLFVAVIAQTRLLETVSFAVLKKNKGAVVPTIAAITALVSFSSGILDGVSMIGLTIRTLVIILFLARAQDEAVLYAVMVSTIVTTVCGMWLAYGEPPNLIMKANLHPYLDNAFFLRFCLPAAVGSYGIVLWNMRRRLSGRKVETEHLDILDLHTADVRFLQAEKHGKVLIPIEFIDGYADLLGSHLEAVTQRLHQGAPFGLALVEEKVDAQTRRKLLGEFISEDLAESLDDHYLHLARGEEDARDQSAQKIRNILESISHRRVQSQKVGFLSFIPFIGFLVWHAFDHHLPLFLASFAGFFAALSGIWSIPKMRQLAFREAKHEYAEYLFLFPLFFSITLLQKSGFFNQISEWMQLGIEKLGAAHLAYLQFIGATFLSAMLDNNIVADFTSRALHGLSVGALHLFAMAQIAGYATGGCWTHIGSAQSVVAYAFIRKEVSEHFTPFQWIKTITPIILEIWLFMTFIVYGEGFILSHFR